MIRFAFGLALGLALAAVAPAQAPDLSKLDLIERNVPDGPVAQVDGVPVSKDSFLYLYRTEIVTLKALHQDAGVSDTDRINTAIACVTELVQRELLVSEAAQRKVTVSDADVQKAYDDELKSLQASLSKEGVTKSEDELLREGGRTREEAKAEIRKALLVEHVRAEIVKEKGVTVSDAEVKEFYDKNQSRFLKGGGAHLKQIFVRPKPDAKSANDASWGEARSRMEKAIARIQAGENFEAVAKAMSEAPNAEQGGDLGVTPVDKLPPFYREAVTKMKIGELSPIIKSEFGLHMIQLLSIEDESTVSFDQVKERVRKVLLQGKAEKVVDDYCRPLYDNAKRVQVFLSLERAIAAIPESERAAANPSATKATPAPKSKASETKSTVKPAESKGSKKAGKK